jgi:hypothetical protein
MSKLNLIAGYGDDINDHDVIEYKPEDDDPLKLMSEIFPLNGRAIHPLKPHYASRPSLASRTLSETSPEAYIRHEDPKQGITGSLVTAIVPVPQYSLSEQIQNRTAMNQKSERDTKIEIDPPTLKSSTFGSLLGLRMGFGSLAKLNNFGRSQDINQNSNTKSGSSIDVRGITNSFGSKGDLPRDAKSDNPENLVSIPLSPKPKWTVSKESLSDSEGSLSSTRSLKVGRTSPKISSSARSFEESNRIPARASPVVGPSNLRNVVGFSKSSTQEEYAENRESDRVSSDGL